ncbi:hypothetical protein HID58_013466 [Brassica napus]|uniref:Dirigent protein n=1 Tax=Brassica napus TaxID=3708 RepID=A0ABQ8E3Y5_BRANA|nr:hypothetical protein HID58_013466 [Brassica napus]
MNPSKNYTGATGFGLTRMIDNPLTMAPELSSKMVGRAQGFYAAVSKEEVGLLMAMNFAILEGKYNGSTITVFGRNSVFDKVREMPVIGGSGLFRFARGYVQARTHVFDIKTGNAVVEYNCKRKEIPTKEAEKNAKKKKKVSTEESATVTDGVVSEPINVLVQAAVAVDKQGDEEWEHVANDEVEEGGIDEETEGEEGSAGGSDEESNDGEANGSDEENEGEADGSDE